MNLYVKAKTQGHVKFNNKMPMLLDALINNSVQLRQRLMCAGGFQEPRFDDSIEEPPGLSMDKVCYSRRVQSRIATGKGTKRDIQEKTGTSLPSALLVESHIIPQMISCGSTCESLSIREAQRLGVQGFYWG